MSKTRPESAPEPIPAAIAAREEPANASSSELSPEMAASTEEPDGPKKEARAASQARPEPQPKPKPKRKLGHSTYYLNRELSWLAFNERVLEEAESGKTPLLDRAKFLSIFGSNLDEFFMVRVSGLRRQMQTGVVTAPPDGMTPIAQMSAIRERLEPLLKRCRRCWEEVRAKLSEAGVSFATFAALEPGEQERLRERFRTEISPILTPLAVDTAHPFPHISSLSLNLAVVLEDDEIERFARVKVPLSLPRFLEVTDERAPLLPGDGVARVRLVFLEDLIAANLDLLFPGIEIRDAYTFRVTRDADLDIEEDEAGDLLTAMADVVERRHFGSAIRLEIEADAPQRVRDLLVHNLGLQEYQVFDTTGPVGLSGLMELYDLDFPELKEAPFQPTLHPALAPEESMFEAIRSSDIVVFHPYDSFQPVVRFLEEAASDPDVVAIKQTLYRVGANSPIVRALMHARQNGKQVSAMVELKARFDEERNIVWARALEEAGVHVVYGLMGLKTHAKICLVVRREEDGIRRYVHLGTGNYNPITARIYTDLGLFTDDPEVGEDVSDLFNAITGYSQKHDYRKLIVAPQEMRNALLARIEREVAVHKQQGGGRLVFKMNSLVDQKCIKALYKASQAGVEIELQVRGICCLRPGVDGVSENIRVTSIVGRFLEHARMYYFRNGGEEELLLGSADLMPRNLDGRVEVLFPIENEALRAALRDDVLLRHVADNRKARRLLPDGSYEPVPREGSKVDAQKLLLQTGGAWRQLPGS